MRPTGVSPARLQDRSLRTAHWRFSVGAAAAALLIVAAAVAPSAQRAASQSTAAQTPVLTLDSLTGRDSFDRYCASCHGSGGRGDGPTASALKTRPVDLTQLARRNGGAYPEVRVRSVISGYDDAVSAHGTSEMPVWGPIFRALDPSDARVAQRLENLVRYIDTLQETSTGPNDPGARLFMIHCASCHGRDGRGAGPVTSALRHEPPDLTRYTARNGGVFPRERVLRIVDGRDIPAHGDRDMPIWGDAFSRREGLSESAARARVEAIVRYLQAIQERAAE